MIDSQNKYGVFITERENKMITNYFDDLWKKAEKLGIKRSVIGRELFGDNHYRYIYSQGRVSSYMQKRHDDIDAVIDRLAQKENK